MIDTPDAPQSIPEKARAKKYKMALLQDEFSIEFGTPPDYRLPKGSVVLVDEETAIRWYERRVADIAPADAVTVSEQRRLAKREEFLKRAQPAEGVFDQAITRSSFSSDRPFERPVMPPEMPKPVRRGKRPPGDPLAMAPVLTDPDEDDEA